MMFGRSSRAFTSAEPMPSPPPKSSHATSIAASSTTTAATNRVPRERPGLTNPLQPIHCPDHGIRRDPPARAINAYRRGWAAIAHPGGVHSSANEAPNTAAPPGGLRDDRRTSLDGASCRPSSSRWAPTASIAVSGLPAWACSQEIGRLPPAMAPRHATNRHGGGRRRPRSRPRQGHRPGRPRSAECRQGPSAERFRRHRAGVWHVVTDGSAGAVTDTQIRSQSKRPERCLQRRRRDYWLPRSRSPMSPARTTRCGTGRNRLALSTR